jgi:hypothetical protein
MALNCEICGKRTPDRKERFCRPHQMALLREMKRAGYLAPLWGRQGSGPFRLSPVAFVTLEDETVEATTEPIPVSNRC